MAKRTAGRHLAFALFLATALCVVGIAGPASGADSLVSVRVVGGSAPLDFDTPLNIYVDDSNRVYIADWSTSHIFTLDSTGKLIREWGTPGSGDGELNNPAGLCADSAGNVYVADYGNHRVVKYSSSGVFIDARGAYGDGHGDLSAPVDVDFGYDGLLYVIDKDRDRVLVFDTGGRLQREWGESGEGKGQLSDAEDIDAAPDGNVYIVDRTNNFFDLRCDRVQEFTPDGHLVAGGGIPDTASGGHTIRSFAVQWDGAIITTDDVDDKIRLYKNGVLVSTYGDAGSDPGQISKPVGISVAPDGLIWVGEVDNSRVQAFKRASGEGGAKPAPPSWPSTQSGEHRTGFLPTNDGYPFSNHASSWSEWDQFTQYFGDTILTPNGDVKFAAQEFYDAEWRRAGDGGTCYGFAASALAVFRGQDKHPLVGTNAKLHDIDRSVLTTEIFDGEKMRNWFLPSQQIDLARAYQPRQNDVRAGAERENSRDSGVASILTSIKEEIDAGRPAIVSIWGVYHGKGAGHALVGYRYENVGDKTRVYVYDCNKIDRTMDDQWVEFDADGGKWAYQLSSDTRWGGPTGGDAMCAMRTIDPIKPPGKGPWEIAEEIWAWYWGDAPLNSVEGWNVTPIEAVQESDSPTTSVSLYSPTLQPLKIDLTANTQRSDLTMFSGSEYVGLSGLQGDDPILQLTSDGAVSVAGSGGSSGFRYAASREDTSASRAVEVEGLAVDGGADTFKPNATFSSVAFSNAGGDIDATVRVHKRGSGSGAYETVDVPFAAGDAGQVVVNDWDALQSNPPLLGIDRGGDGSIDETLTLTPVDATESTATTGGGGGGGSGDAGMLLLVLGLGIAGLVAWVVISSRKTWPAGDSDALGNVPLGGVSQPAEWHVRLDDGRIVALTWGTTRIGRASDNELVLDDPKVSRRHASLDVSPSRLVIQDAGSMTGTFVNGERIERRDLQHGDRITAGDSGMEVLGPSYSIQGS